MTFREVPMPHRVEWNGVTARYSDQGYAQMKLLADRAKAGDEEAAREARFIHELRATFDLREVESDNWFEANLPVRLRQKEAA